MAMTPNEQLLRIIRKHPKTSEHVNIFLSGRGTDLPQWPKWCFMPMAAWYAIAEESGHAEDVAVLSALGTWRYSQGIFRIHPDLFNALMDSTVFGDLPADIFKRLPEFCVYIETPGFIWVGKQIQGFFAHLEWDVNTKREELRLLLNMDDGSLTPIPLHIGEWTVEESVQRMISEASLRVNPEISDIIRSEEYISEMTSISSKLISLLLYICSDEPEVDGDRTPGKVFYHPIPKKTKKGFKLFPADKPHVWRVGEEVGEKLRVNRVVSSARGRTVRAHIRRGHWHGFWIGPRTGKRNFVYRWLPPTIVGSKNT